MLQVIIRIDQKIIYRFNLINMQFQVGSFLGLNEYVDV